MEFEGGRQLFSAWLRQHREKNGREASHLAAFGP
jgi:hypothetical protein